MSNSGFLISDQKNFDESEFSDRRPKTIKMESEVKSLTSEVNIKFEPEEFDFEIDSFQCKSHYSTQGF